MDNSLTRAKMQLYAMKEMPNFMTPGDPRLNALGITGNYQTAFFPYPAVNKGLNEILSVRRFK